MDTLIWLLKVNIAITLLYAFYKLFFQRDTFFKVKRIVLLLSIVFSLLYPFFDVKELFLSKTPYLAENLTAFQFPEFLVLPGGVEEAPQTMSAMDIAGIIWISGVTLFFLYFIFQIISILSKIFTSKRIQVQGMNLYLLKGLKTPFSFFNYILIDSDFHDEQELSEILYHEDTHVREGHTWDVIFSELFCILCWFNPFAWLMKKEIRINLEFLADNFVMKSLKNTEHYQLHLLRLSYHKAIAQLSNNFNVSPLKKRIQMMNKRKSSNAGIIKYALFVPLLVGLLFANNLHAQDVKEEPKNFDKIVVVGYSDVNDPKQIQETQSKIIDLPANKEVFTHVEEMPQFPGGEREMFNFLAKNIKYPVIAQEQKIQGMVVVRFVVAKTGEIMDVAIIRSADPALDKEAIRVVKSMPDWIPGKQKGEAVSVYYTLPVQFKLQGAPSAIPEGVPQSKIIDAAAGLPKEAFTHVEVMPIFLGGVEGMMKYLSENTKYPVEAQKKGIQGTVIVRFIVSKTGKISHATVLRSLDPMLDEEALRVVNAMPDWVPGRQGGKEVDVYYTLPIRYRLDGGTTSSEATLKGYEEMKQLPKDVVITVDGKIVSTEEFNKISPEKIKSIQVIKDTPEHKAGLIEVQLKKE